MLTDNQQTRTPDTMPKQADPTDTARINLRMACALRGRTMAEVSRSAGLGRNAISQFASGRGSLTYRNMVAICDELDLPIELVHTPDGITPTKIRVHKVLSRLSDAALQALVDQVDRDRQG